MKRLLLVLLIAVFSVCPAISRERNFSEYGKAVSLRMGAGGALWEVDLGYEQWEWYAGDTTRDISLTNDRLVGTLETQTTGAPQIDGDFILIIMNIGLEQNQGEKS